MTLVDGFYYINSRDWQVVKNDKAIKIHPGTLNENYNPKLTKVMVPVSCSSFRPYIIENMTKTEFKKYILSL